VRICNGRCNQVKRGRAGAIFAALALVLVAVVPLDPVGHAHWGKVALIPFVSPPVRLLDVLGNLLLGVPAGLASSWGFRRGVLAAVLLTTPVSLLGEWTQLYSHSRFPSATDVVCNVAGAMIAAAAYSAVMRRRGDTR